MDYRQIQEDEVEALAAIFGDDFVLVKKKRRLSDVPEDPKISFRIHLVPHPGNPADNHSSLRIYINFPPAYPSVPPEWNIDSSQGLSDADLAELRDLIRLTVRLHHLCSFPPLRIQDSQGWTG